MGVSAAIKSLVDSVSVLWAPFPGMQTAFVNAAEDEVLGGGAKGPGKTDCIEIAASRQVGKARYKALLTRETGPQLREMKDRSHRYYGRHHLKPHWNGDGHGRWTWPSGAIIQFEAIGTFDEVERIHGQEWAFIGSDEVGNIREERTIDRMQAEIRCPDPSVVTMWRGTANPGGPGQAWIKRRFITPCGKDGRRIAIRKVTIPHTGEVAYLRRRFIPGTVLDNPIYANDPKYMAILATLPETLRLQLLYGDWDAGYGTALDELNESVHIVPPFVVPEHWPRFGAFDYGFAHNWCWSAATATEDGRVYVIDTVWGRRHLVHEIAERVKTRLPVHHKRYITTVTDSFAFQDRSKMRRDNTPTIAEELMQHDLIVVRGNTDRKAGLTNLRHYVAWKGLGHDGGDGDPGVYFMDTPGNRKLFEQLQSMVVDPDEMEDVLKVNADPETGEGGDDGYDAFRLLMASRPPRAVGLFLQTPVRAFSKETLKFMVEHLYKDGPALQPRGSTRGGGSLYTYLTGS